MHGEIEFAEAARFAKVVSTKDGEALLIGGRVYMVTGPDGNAAELFASAFRNMSVTGVASTSEGAALLGDTAARRSNALNVLANRHLAADDERQFG